MSFQTKNYQNKKKNRINKVLLSLNNIYYHLLLNNKT